jgi:hypothetical protein
VLLTSDGRIRIDYQFVEGGAMRVYHLSPAAGFTGPALRVQPVRDPAPSEALVRVGATGRTCRADPGGTLVFVGLGRRC